jgi:hypothetical protein
MTIGFERNFIKHHAFGNFIPKKNHSNTTNIFPIQGLPYGIVNTLGRT